MAGTKQSVVKGAAWIGLGRIVLAMLGFVSTVILARLLMPEDFGLVAIASAAAMMVATVTELPLSQAIIHHDDPDDDHLHTIWTFGLLKGLAMFALIAIAAKPLAIAYGDPRLTNLLLVLAVSAALGSIQNPSFGSLRAGNGLLAERHTRSPRQGLRPRRIRRHRLSVPVVLGARAGRAHFGCRPRHHVLSVAAISPARDAFQSA